MRRLTKPECLQWLDAHHLAQEGGGHHFLPSEGGAFALDFTQPQSSRGNAVLARYVADAVLDGGKALLFITEWGVWPTEESWPLFERAMIGYGDPRPMHEAPGFLFDAHELDDLTALARLALISGWSGGVLSATRQVGFSLTDDDWVSIYAESEATVRRWVDEKFFLTFDVRVLWEGDI